MHLISQLVIYFSPIAQLVIWLPPIAQLVEFLYGSNRWVCDRRSTGSGTQRGSQAVCRDGNTNFALSIELIGDE
jgi:hypothetical protein